MRWRIDLTAWRTRIALVVLTTAAMAVGLVVAGQDRPIVRAPDPAGRPNVILIVSDDLGLRLGAYGDPIADTPNIDRLAREGVRFTNMFATAPVCAPSRAAIITGVHQQNLGAMHMRTTPERSGALLGGGSPYRYQAVPPEDVRAFPQLLRGAGFFTSNREKTDYQFGEPFTIWDESGPNASWRHRPDGAPFFHMRTIMLTHESYGVTFWRAPRNLKDGLAQIRNASDLGGFVGQTDPQQVTVPPWLVDAPRTRRQLAQMYDAIHASDAEIGELLEQLEADGVLDNTIVVVTSDNGEGLPRAKRSLTDSGVRMPFIVRFPDQRHADEVRDDLASFVDIAPTLLAFAGVERPDFMQGRDLFSSEVEPAFVFAAADRFDAVPTRSKLVRDHRFAYIRNYDTSHPALYRHAARDMLPAAWDLWRARDAGRLTPVQHHYMDEPLAAEELYDINVDPLQLNNLAGDAAFAEARERMASALDAFNARAPDLSEIPEDQLIERFWPGGVQPQTARPEAHAEAGLLHLQSRTSGASIGWRYRSDPRERWRLYVEPIPMRPGEGVEAKAIRYGYAESDLLIWTQP